MKQETLRTILEGTIDNEPFKIYQEKNKSVNEWLELNLSKEQALAFLSNEILDTPARFDSDMYSINHIVLLNK